MFGRAELQRTVVLVVALLLTAGSTDAFAREFRAADTWNEDYPAVQALRFMGRQINERTSGRHGMEILGSFEPCGFAGLAFCDSGARSIYIVSDIDRKPFEAAMGGIYAREQRDPASAQLIERIRKVE